MQQTELSGILLMDKPQGFTSHDVVAKLRGILHEYHDRNTVVTLLSLGHDAQALEILDGLEQSATTEYLKAVACSRLGRKAEGREHFLNACGMDERMQYRGNLDPEITELLKE